MKASFRWNKIWDGLYAVCYGQMRLYHVKTQAAAQLIVDTNNGLIEKYHTTEGD